MRIREGFQRMKIGGADCVVPVGKRRAEFDGMITLNESGALIWKCLERGMDAEGITDTILEEYDADRETAAGCVYDFLEKLRTIGCIEE